METLRSLISVLDIDIAVPTPTYMEDGRPPSN